MGTLASLENRPLAAVLTDIDDHAEMLSDDAVRSDETGSTSTAVADFLIRSGCLCVTGSRSSGGLGEGAGAVVRLALRLAQHHPSAAWNMVASTSHLASAQSFPGNPFRDSGSPIPSLCGSYGSTDARARRSEDGYLVSGSWGPASNAEHASWATIDAAHDELGRVIMIVPMETLTVRPSWRSLGLRGTASHTLVAAEMFVPEECLMSAEQFFRDGPAGSPLAQRQPKVLRTSTGFAAVALGATKALSARIARRAAGLDAAAAVAASTLGEADSMLDAAETLLLASADHLDAVPRGGGSLSPAETVRARARLSRAVRDIADAVHELSFLAGSARTAEGNDIGRLWRDAHSALSHGALLPAGGFAPLGGLLTAPYRPDPHPTGDTP